MEEPLQALHEPVKVLQVPAQKPAQREQTTEVLDPAKAPQEEAKILRPKHDGLANEKEATKKKTEEAESCTPAPMPAGLEAAIGKGDQGLKIRLQCWDCPGQQEYALLNQLYFAQGIYVVVCDMSQDPRETTVFGWRFLSSLAVFCSMKQHENPSSFLVSRSDLPSAVQRRAMQCTHRTLLAPKLLAQRHLRMNPQRGKLVTDPALPTETLGGLGSFVLERGQLCFRHSCGRLQI